MIFCEINLLHLLSTFLKQISHKRPLYTFTMRDIDCCNPCNGRNHYSGSHPPCPLKFVHWFILLFQLINSLIRQLSIIKLHAEFEKCGLGLFHLHLIFSIILDVNEIESNCPLTLCMLLILMFQCFIPFHHFTELSGFRWLNHSSIKPE